MRERSRSSAVFGIVQRVQSREPGRRDGVVGTGDARVVEVPRGQVPAVREVLDGAVQVGVVADQIVAEKQRDVRLLLGEVLEDLDKRFAKLVAARRLSGLLEQPGGVELGVVANGVIKGVGAVEEHLVRQRVERVGVQPEHDRHVPRLVARDRLRAGVLRRRVRPLDILAVDRIGATLRLGGPVLVVEPGTIDRLNDDVDAEIVAELLGDEFGGEL